MPRMVERALGGRAPRGARLHDAVEVGNVVRAIVADEGEARGDLDLVVDEEAAWFSVSFCPRYVKSTYFNR